MPTVHQFKVEMTCGGCSDAVKRVLAKLGDDKIKNLDIDLDKKLVFVTSDEPSEVLLETIKKTGKETSYLGEV